MEISDRVREIASRYTEERNIEIIDIIYRREQPGMVLRLLVDKPEGITMAECEAINNYLSEELDKADVIQDRYVLEVSSPGLDRPLKTDRDFERVIGQRIEVMTYEPIEGKKSRAGSLIGMDKETVVVEDGGISTVIPRNKIALARLKIDF
jgi:ribosome maturation factor RimP